MFVGTTSATLKKKLLQRQMAADRRSMARIPRMIRSHTAGEFAPAGIGF